MGAKSSIEWTDASWSPIRARDPITNKIGWHCEHVTTGCINCYAEGMNKRLGTGLQFKPGNRNVIEIFLDEEMLLAPLRWRKPRMIFVCSMTDAFAKFVKDEWLDKMFDQMERADWHTYQILTKRSERMRDYMLKRFAAKQRYADAFKNCPTPAMRDSPAARDARARAKPEFWKNFWLGVSAERQQEWDERKEHLKNTPAAVHFASFEPLLGGIVEPRPMSDYLQWAIVGGESGPHARLMHPDWARSLQKQCEAAGVEYFFKQWGEYLPVGQSLPGCGKVLGATAVKPGRMKLHYAGTPKQAPRYAFAERGVEFASTTDDRLTFRVGKKAAGRLLDGREWNQMPAGASV